VTTAQVAAVTFGFYSDAEVHRTAGFTSKALLPLPILAQLVYNKSAIFLWLVICISMTPPRALAVC